MLAPNQGIASSWQSVTTLLNADSPGAFWIPPGSAPLNGIVICLHGFGLNAASYDAFGKVMAQRGYALFAPDIRGFGYWRESGAHPKLDLNLAVQDVCKIAKAIKSEYPDVPLFILGESMGGAIGLTVASKEPGIDGLIAAVPSAERFGRKKATAKVGVRFLLDKNKEMDVTQKVVDRAVSCDELRRMWLSDPRNRVHVSPNELLHFQRFMNAAMVRAREIDKTPVLLVQGCQDNLVKPRATVKLYESLRTHDKRLLMVDEAEHLIFQKGQFNNQIVDTVETWLREHPKAVSK